MTSWVDKLGCLLFGHFECVGPCIRYPWGNGKLHCSVCGIDLKGKK